MKFYHLFPWDICFWEVSVKDVGYCLRTCYLQPPTSVLQEKVGHPLSGQYGHVISVSEKWSTLLAGKLYTNYTYTIYMCTLYMYICTYTHIYMFIHCIMYTTWYVTCTSAHAHNTCTYFTYQWFLFLFQLYTKRL